MRGNDDAIKIYSWYQKIKMKNTLLLKYSFYCILIHIFNVISITGSGQTTSAERFTGVHFDFHAKETDRNIGKNYTPAMADSFLQLVKPDFLQIDCKGVSGYSSYPASVGNAAPEISKDLMRIWSDASKKNNTSLYAHYSALLDTRAVKQHPGWAITNADGSKENIISPASNYSDELMIPQLKELALKYKISGVWVDSDCWAVKTDYNPALIKAFKTKHPNAAVPVKQGDTFYADWIAVNRECYKKYLSHYVEALHKESPGFKIISNWAYSAYMPEKIDVDVDFLSGDIRGNTPYEAAFEGRCMAAKNKPWDLMTWSQVSRNNKMVIKSYRQMIQEAANILAVGGGFQTYWQQGRDGGLPAEHFNTIKDIIAFCRQRKEYTFKGNIVPQVGLLFSDEIWKNQLITDHLYAETGLGYVKQVFKILSDAQYSTDILMHYDLDKKLSAYPALVVPLWSSLSAAVVQQLISYANNGGNVLVIGAAAVKQFAAACNINLKGGVLRTKDVKLFLDSSVTIKTDIQPVTVNSATTIIGKISGDGADYPAATIHNIGKGKIGLIYFDTKNLYGNEHVTMVKDFTASVLSKMFINPIVTIKNAPLVEQVVTTKNDHLFIHLINMRGSESLYDNAPAVPAFHIEVKRSVRPAAVILQPGNKKLDYTYSNGKIDITIPGLDIYSIVQID